MPQYVWKCSACGSEVEVFRHMCDCGMPPINGCPKCKSELMVKTVQPVITIMREAHNSAFPLTVKGLHKVVVTKDNVPVRDEMNRPVVEYRDVTFASKSHQDQWLKDHEMVRMEDGRDPEIGRSQHSAFDQRESPPPSQEAVRMAERATFIEPREVYDLASLGAAS